ncbi:hypothetical protein BHM03_00009197, partial [Ensete ventricosum]
MSFHRRGGATVAAEGNGVAMWQRRWQGRPSVVTFEVADGAEIVEGSGCCRGGVATLQVLRLAVAFGHATGKKKGATGSDEGCRRGGGLLAAAGGTVNTIGQRLAATVGRWPRAGEGGGSGVSVRSAQRWLRLRAREDAIEATLEEKGR